jgi:FkbM family methyltransferase
MYNSPLMIKVRNVARTLGVTKVLSKLRSSDVYEERFGNAMLAAVRPGAVVWDIGANIGFYTAKFAQGVGPQGKVVAFEPTPPAFAKLKAATAQCPNVVYVNAALGSKNGSVTFDLGTGDGDPTARIVDGSRKASGTTVQLPIYTGQEAMRRESLPQPTFVKIDVEGFEPDVVEGLGSVLASQDCKDVFIEVHFGLLDQRGKSASVEDIRKSLLGMGYNVQWIDASHLHAKR